MPVQRMVPVAEEAVAEEAVAEVPMPAAIRPMAEVANVAPWRATGQPPLLVSVSVVALQPHMVVAVHYSSGRRSGGDGPAIVLHRRLH